jgi:hypothetical protein
MSITHLLEKRRRIIKQLPASILTAIRDTPKQPDPAGYERPAGQRTLPT